MAIPGFGAASMMAERDGRERDVAPRMTGAAKVESTEGRAAQANESRKPYRVNLPGFISEEIGLGDLIKRMTWTVGIRPCDGCLRRAQALNAWMTLAPRSRR